MWTFVLSFAGLPFTGGFLGKFYVFAAAFDAGWWPLVLVGVVATAVSLYYYLGIVKAMYMRPSPAAGPAVLVAGGPPPRDAALGLGVAGAVAVTVGSFFFVQPLVDPRARQPTRSPGRPYFSSATISAAARSPVSTAPLR